jgi:uncharacterized protein (TIGR03032 family)
MFNSLLFECSSNLASTHSSKLQIICSRQLIDWLREQHLSFAFTTYQTSRLCFIGINKKNQITGFERLFDRAMGLYTTANSLYLSTKYQLWQLENVLAPGQSYQSCDKLYVPRIGYTTGDLDIHDLVVDLTGRPIFISSLLNCLATVSQKNSCIPLWKPPFISKIVNEDRCHLNGLAMVEGRPRYVTAVSQSDVVDGWRDKRREGGCIIDVSTNEVILKGLSMPHSPRWYRDKLWLLNSGTGEFGYVDLQAGRFEPVTFCPGYARGLAFWKDWAVVALSQPRGEDKTFSGLELDERLIAKDVVPRCGLVVIDLNSGAIVHWLRLEGVVTEIYDVQVLPGVLNPMALGFQTDEISRLLTLDPVADLSFDVKS